jgi:hypothetical protein
MISLVVGILIYRKIQDRKFLISVSLLVSSLICYVPLSGILRIDGLLRIATAVFLFCTFFTSSGYMIVSNQTHKKPIGLILGAMILVNVPGIFYGIEAFAGWRFTDLIYNNVPLAFLWLGIGYLVVSLFACTLFVLLYNQLKKK